MASANRIQKKNSNKKSQIEIDDNMDKENTATSPNPAITTPVKRWVMDDDNVDDELVSEFKRIELRGRQAPEPLLVVSSYTLPRLSIFAASQSFPRTVAGVYARAGIFFRMSCDELEKGNGGWGFRGDVGAEVEEDVVLARVSVSCNAGFFLGCCGGEAECGR